MTPIVSLEHNATAPRTARRPDDALHAVPFPIATGCDPTEGAAVCRETGG